MSHIKALPIKALNFLVILGLLISGLALNSSLVKANVDVVVPAITGLMITGPTAGNPAYARSGSTVTVTFTAGVAGGGGTGQFQILLGSSVYGPYAATFDGTAISQDILIPSVTDAHYNLEVDAKLDTETHFTTATEVGAVVVDNVPPVIPAKLVLTPNGGEVLQLGSSYNITWDTTISDPEGNLGSTPINIYFSSNGGGNWTPVATKQSNTGIFGWTVPSVITTQALIKIVVLNLAGNSASDTSDAVFSIYGVDTTPPTVSMFLPSGGFVGGAATPLQALAQDPESGIAGVTFQYSLDGGAWLDAGNGSFSGGHLPSYNYVGSFNTTTLPDGHQIQFRAIATNGAGASTTSAASTAAVIDNSAPIVNLLAPAADGSWLKASYTFAANASDPDSGLASMVVTQHLSGETATTWHVACSDLTSQAVSPTFSCTAAITSTVNQIKVVITNGAGLSTTVLRTVNYDDVYPVIPVPMLNQPAIGSILQIGTQVAITWFTTTPPISDAHLATNPISLYLITGGGSEVPIASNLAITPATFTWVVSGIPDQNDHICVGVSDLAGNRSYDCHAVTIWGVDTTPPLVSLNSVASPNKGSISLSATASDPESLISNVTFSYRPGLTGAWTQILAPVTAAPYTVAWNTAGMDGNFYLMATATNGVGAQASSVVGPVLIDNTAPLYGSILPADGATIKNKVIFSVGVTDPAPGGGSGSGVKTVAFEYALVGKALVVPTTKWNAMGNGVKNVGTGMYDSPVFDTTMFPAGDVSLRVTMTDNAGNVAPQKIFGYTIVAANGTTWNIDLVAGWNLISTPLIIPSDNNQNAINTVLADLIAHGSVVQVVAWPYANGGIHEQRWDGGALLDVTEIADGVGYWVQMSKPDRLVINGTELPVPPATPPSYDVHTGWNLIGFKSVNPMWADDYLGSAGYNMEAMYGYNASLGIYQTIVLGYTGLQLQPGQGYWLAVSYDGTIYP